MTTKIYKRLKKNAKGFKTNSEVFDATDIKQTQTQKVYKIYQIPP